MGAVGVHGEGSVRARNYSVSQVLIGTHRVGLVGLGACLHSIDDSGLEDREAIVDLMMEELSASNFIPDARIEVYRTAVWREYLRHHGKDFSEFYSEIPVTIRGGSAEERDHLARLITSALAVHELRPSTTVEPAAGESVEPVLEIEGDAVINGVPTLIALKKVVRHRLSDW